MTDIITERLKAIRLRLKGDITYKDGTAVYTYQNEIDQLSAIQSTISSAETDAAELQKMLVRNSWDIEGSYPSAKSPVEILTAALLKAQDKP